MKFQKKTSFYFCLAVLEQEDMLTDRRLAPWPLGEQAYNLLCGGKQKSTTAAALPPAVVLFQSDFCFE